MNSHVQVSQLGVAYLPPKYISSGNSSSLRAFACQTGGLNKPAKYLKHGGTVVLTGSWSAVQQMATDLLRRESDIIGHVLDRKERQLAKRSLPKRLLTEISVLTAEIEPDVLAGFCGIDELPELPIIVPIDEAAKIMKRIKEGFYIPGINAELIVHPEVLVPQSKETIALMTSALRNCAKHLTATPEVLDMGCGSGVLSLAAANTWPNGKITATDILPEAVATTLLNARRATDRGLISASISAAKSGDLFDNLTGQVFDLIIFNAPWVAAPAHNRAELALNDKDQSTICRFLSDCVPHLAEHGLVVVGYADNSGPKAMARFEQAIDNSGLIVYHVLKDRIKTYRSNRPWQNIYAYVLARA